MATLTWLGHASFLLASDEGKRVYIDPWLTGNPKAPEGAGEPERVDIIAVTHGHSDHVGDTVAALAGAPGRADRLPGRAQGLARRPGRERRAPSGLNKGGSQELDGLRFTLTNAFHSSSSDSLEYLGEACGIVVRLESGRRSTSPATPASSATWR